MNLSYWDGFWTAVIGSLVLGAVFTMGCIFGSTFRIETVQPTAEASE